MLHVPENFSVYAEHLSTLIQQLVSELFIKFLKGRRPEVSKEALASTARPRAAQKDTSGDS